jgi:hypothetical protein
LLPAYTGAALTLAPGVYCADAAVKFTDSTLTLDLTVNQSLGNGPEDCYPGNSNLHNHFLQDEDGGKRGDPSRKGGDKQSLQSRRNKNGP